ALEGASFWSRSHDSELSSLLTGTVDGEEVALFEAWRMLGEPQTRFTGFTVAIVPTLPAFDLRFAGMLDRIGQIFEGRAIDFDSHPVFSDRYLLRSDDEAAVRRLFSPSLLEYFESARFDFRVESFGGRLLLTTHWERIDTDDADGFLDEGFELARRIRQADAARNVEK
ncbi:MAG: hypothetical protein AAGE94_21175, partial [Acidobacteriota bacterium]